MCVSVCLLACLSASVTIMSCAKTAEPIKMPFGVQTVDSGDPMEPVISKNVVVSCTLWS